MKLSGAWPAIVASETKHEDANPKAKATVPEAWEMMGFCQLSAI